MKKLSVILIVGLLIISGVYLYKAFSVKNSTVTINDARYFNMQFKYPEGYKKAESTLGVFRVESSDFHSSSYGAGTIMDQGARIDLHNQDSTSGRIFLSQEEWIKGKISSAFSNETVTENSINGTPVVIVESNPTESKPPFIYNKSIHFLNQEEKNEVVLELSVAASTKDGFSTYKAAFDKMVSTIKLNP